MQTAKFILVGFALGVLALYGCQKVVTPAPYQAPPLVEVAKDAPVPNVVAAQPAAPTPAFSAAVKPSTSSKGSVTGIHKYKAKPATKSATTSTEKLYEMQGQANAQYAECLVTVVDHKIDMDVQLHQIRDFGNAIGTICTRYHVDVIALAGKK